LRARHLVFAHAALTDVATGKLVHAERWSRWNGHADPTAPAGARLDDTGVHLGRWHLRRHGPVQASVYEGSWEDESAGFGLQLTLQSPQPPVLQGDQGYSRKSPRPGHASGYYSQPQLRVRGQLRLQGQTQAVQGVGWLDHEWSQALLDPEAVGWDWMGLNLDDGGALTVFRLRRQDGSVLWAGGSWRTAQGAMRSFTPQEVLMRPERSWRSPATNGLYPVEWTVQTPAGQHRVQGLADAQELDNRARTGTVYWEGISRVLDEQGRSVGVGYLEMTGYAGRLQL
jgi:predicted secreted hydrolase